jgi:hypothetical protein
MAGRRLCGADQGRITTPTMELPDSLEECHKLIRHLLEENAALRQSGTAFGHLAERLNSELREERRQGRERRLVPRAVDDRRTSGIIPRK